MQNEHTLWVEKYRPSTLDTYIGNDQLKSKVAVYLESGDLPHLLLFGKAGTGKTTLAKLLVNNIDCDYLYINPSDILTCNFVERIIDPIQSRCQAFQVIPPSKKDVAVHLSNILKQEEIESELSDIGLLVNSGYPDIRRVINGAQRQSVGGKLVIDKQSIIENDYKLKLLKILEPQDRKNAFNNIRQLVADAKITDFADLFRLLYDEVDTYGKGHIASCILIIAKYELSDAQVVDKEINAMAMLIEILQTIK